MSLYRSQFRKYEFIFLGLLSSVFILFLVLLTLQQANPLDTKLERDSGAYLYIANTLLHGKLPYVDVWESKPPGIFFINAFGLWLGSGTRWGIWLVEFLFLFSSAQLLFSFLKKHFSIFASIIGVSVNFWGLSKILAGGNFTEEYSLLFSFIALWLWNYSENKKIVWCDIGIGFCVGCTILLRPNNIGVQASIMLVLLIGAFKEKGVQSLLKRFLIIAISAFIPLFITGLFFASRNSFYELIEGSFLYNFYYTGSNFNLKSSVLVGISSLGGAGGLFLLGYCFVAYHFFYKKNNLHNTISTWILINGILEFFLSGLSGRAYEHYFICWIPNVAVSSAYLIFFVFPEINLSLGKYKHYVLLSAIVVEVILFPHIPQYYLNTMNYLFNRKEVSIQKTDPVAEYVNVNTENGDFVLVWGGQSGINFLSNRESPTPYIFYPLFPPSPFNEKISLAYYQKLQINKPILIVDGSVYDSERIVRLDEKSPLVWMKERGLYVNLYLFEIITFIRNNYSFSEEVNGVPIYKLNK